MGTRILTPSGRKVIPIYAAAFLDGSHKAELLSSFLVREGWTKFGDHMTLKFRPSQEWIDDFVRDFLGKGVRLYSPGYVCDTKCLAIVINTMGDTDFDFVDIPSLFREVDNPHVTVCCNNVKPKYSQGLVRQSTVTKWNTNTGADALRLYRARLGVFDAKTNEPYFGED